MEDDSISVLDEVIRNSEIAALRKALTRLDEVEFILIKELFLTETPGCISQYARKHGMAKSTVHKSVTQILSKLKDLLDNE